MEQNIRWSMLGDRSFVFFLFFHRSNCFGSEIFLGCMDYLVYDRERVVDLATLVRGVHRYFRK